MDPNVDLIKEIKVKFSNVTDMAQSFSFDYHLVSQQNLLTTPIRQLTFNTMAPTILHSLGQLVGEVSLTQVPPTESECSKCLPAVAL